MQMKIRKSITSLGKFGNEAFVFVFLLLKFVKYYISPDSPPVLSLRLAALLAVTAGCAVLFGALIRRSGEAEKTSVTVLLALFLASPASNDVLLLDLWFKDNVVFINLFALACAVSSFFLINRSKGKWLLPLLCFTGTVLKPLFVFTLLPIPILLIIECIGQSADTGEKSEYKDLLVSTLVASVIGFLLFGARRAFLSADDFPALLAEGAKRTAMKVAIVLPLFAVFAVLSVFAHRNISGQGSGKTALLITFLPLFGFVDPFAAASTGPSALMSAVFAQACLWAYFLYRGFRPYCVAAARLEAFFRGNQLLLWLLFIWLSAFSGLGKIMLIGLTKSKSYFQIWQ